LTPGLRGVGNANPHRRLPVSRAGTPGSAPSGRPHDESCGAFLDACRMGTAPLAEAVESPEQVPTRSRWGVRFERTTFGSSWHKFWGHGFRVPQALSGTALARVRDRGASSTAWFREPASDPSRVFKTSRESRYSTASCPGRVGIDVRNWERAGARNDTKKKARATMDGSLPAAAWSAASRRPAYSGALQPTWWETDAEVSTLTSG
jgi:hypothetical protein